MAVDTIMNMNRRAFRIARHLAVFLVLGAILNVAVAWGCALSLTPSWPDRCWSGQYLVKPQRVEWLITLFERIGSSYLFSTGWIVPDSPPIESIDISEGAGWLQQKQLPSWTRLHHLAKPDFDALERQVWHERAYGLPCRSLYYAYELASEPD